MWLKVAPLHDIRTCFSYRILRVRVSKQKGPFVATLGDIVDILNVSNIFVKNDCSPVCHTVFDFED